MGGESGQQVQTERVGAIGKGLRRIVVDLQEDAIDADSHGRAREGRDELRRATGARQLNGVGGIENDRIAELPHHD